MSSTCLPALAIPSLNDQDAETAEKPFKKPRHGPNPAHTLANCEVPECVLLQSWTQQAGGKIDGTSVRRSDENNGAGVYAEKDFKAGDVLGMIPLTCILTPEKAAQSPLGTALQQFSVSLQAPKDTQGEALCTPETVLFLWMIAGRFAAEHPWHAYLASLPAVAPDVCSWPSSLSLAEELKGTQLLEAYRMALARVTAVWEGLASKFADAHPQHLPAAAIALHGGGVPALLWARGMYLSRRFPLRMSTAGDEPPQQGGEGEAQSGLGCLLPFLDLLNHKRGTPILWQHSAAGVAFSIPADAPHGAVTAGSEMFNNYGDKDNEQLLWAYGFAIPDNPADTVALSLAAGPSDDGPGYSLGTFQIRCMEDGGVPLELWRIFSDDVPESDSEDDRDPIQPNELVIDPMAINAVCSQMRSMYKKMDQWRKGDDIIMAAFREGRADDPVTSAIADPNLQRLRRYLAYYRDGRRRILQDVTAAWEDVLLNQLEEQYD